MLNWNSNPELDRASISNFKAPGLEIQKGNCSKLSFIADVLSFRRFITMHSEANLSQTANGAVVGKIVC